MKATTVLFCTAAIIALPVTAFADGHRNFDRIEDRIDRIESRRDERVDLGPRDVIEDRVDRLESRLDRAGIENTPRIDRWERRSWARRWR